MAVECDHPRAICVGVPIQPVVAAERGSSALARAGALGWIGAALFAALVLDPGFLTLGDPTRRLLAAGLVAAWASWARSPCRDATDGHWPAIASGALILALFWLPVPACGAALAAALLLAARGSTEAVRESAHTAAWAVAGLGVSRCAVSCSSLGWQANVAAATAWSRLTSTLAGTHVALGADVAGLPVVIAFAFGSAARAGLVAAPGRAGRAVAGAVAATAILALLVSTALLRWRPEGPAPSDLCARHLFLFAGLLPSVLFCPWRVGADRPPSTIDPSRLSSGLGGWGTPSLAIAAAVIAVCALLCQSFRLRQPVPIAGKRVGLFVTSSTPWERSAAAGHGGVAAATVGDLAGLLAALGCRVRRLDGALDTRALHELDALVLYTPGRPFTPAEQLAVARFVRAGGGLMALGEHTDLAGNRDRLNPLLRGFGIAVNDDAALAVAGEPWRTAIAVRPHPILPADTTTERYGVAIGATLSVTPAAQPLLVGRGLFADRAAPGPELGDLVYRRPEPLGDVILAATATPGRGRVLVFGDPSPIMNYPLHCTDAMLCRAIGWLTGGPAGFGLAVALGFCLCAGLALLATPGQTPAARALAVLLAGPLALLVIPSAAAMDRVALPAGAAALIDSSHREALATNDGFTVSTAGLARGLRRAGYLPSRLDRFCSRTVARAGALVLLSPTRDFSEGELAAVDRMLARGGTVLLAIGWADQPPVPRLMRFLRVCVAPTPLGPVAAAVDGVEAHFPAAWELSSRDPAYVSLCGRWGRPVVLEGRRRGGRIVVVGDPAVLLGDRMEGHERFDLGNIRLLQRLLSGPASKGARR
jgi:hypothetical protein